MDPACIMDMSAIIDCEAAFQKEAAVEAALEEAEAFGVVRLPTKRGGDDGSTQSPGARKRLRGKQFVESLSPPREELCCLADGDPASELPEKDPDAAQCQVEPGLQWKAFSDQAWESMGHAVRQKTFHNKFYYWLTKAKVDAKTCDDEERLRVLLGHKGWDRRAKKTEEHWQALDWFEQDTAPPVCVRAWIEKVIRANQPQGDKKKVFVKASQVLLTWQGNWGLAPDDFFVDDVDLNYLCDRLRMSSWAQGLRDEFQHFVDELVQQLFLDVWLFSIELCTKTLQTQNLVRLHVHAFFKKDSQIFVRSPISLAFKNSIPNRAAQLHGQRVLKQGSWCGAYYVQCPKKGSLWTFGIRQAFEDYQVSGSWVFNLVQAGKMDYQVAREQLAGVI